MNAYFENTIQKDYISAYQNDYYFGGREMHLESFYYDDFINFFKKMKKKELIEFCHYYDTPKVSMRLKKIDIIAVIFHWYFRKDINFIKISVLIIF